MEHAAVELPPADPVADLVLEFGQSSFGGRGFCRAVSGLLGLAPRIAGLFQQGLLMIPRRQCFLWLPNGPYFRRALRRISDHLRVTGIPGGGGLLQMCATPSASVQV
jgi:hypothetical protein